jgi:ABC-type multidrug transport system fused ATPase/permease subunit
MPSDSKNLQQTSRLQVGKNNADFIQKTISRIKEWLEELNSGLKTHPTASKEELEAFIQKRVYYYLPKWELLDHSMKRIAPGTFNWAAFFFTTFWMAYRKMYLYTIVIWITLAVFLTVAELAIGGSGGASAANAGWFAALFFFGRYGNSMYKNYVEMKIRQIKKTVTPEYQNQALKDCGGTNWLATIPLIIFQVLTILSSIVLALAGKQQ